MKKLLIILATLALLALPLVNADIFGSVTTDGTYLSQFQRLGHNITASSPQLEGQEFNISGTGTYYLDSITFLPIASVGGALVNLRLTLYADSADIPAEPVLIYNESSLTPVVYTNCAGASQAIYNFSSYPLTYGNHYWIVFSSSNVSGAPNPNICAGANANLSENAEYKAETSTSWVDETKKVAMLITYHNASVVEPASVTLNRQSPSNVTSQSLFTQAVNITYLYNNSPTWTGQQINYTLTSNALSCLQVINGTCQYLNATMLNATPTSLTNGTNYTLADYVLSENDVYSSNANLGTAYFTQTHSAQTLSTDNHLIKTEFLNITVTGTTYNIYEAMVNTTGISRVYVCNSTYTTGNVVTSPNCQEIGEINSTGYNHTHGSGASAHNLVPFVISGGRVNAGITATSQMYFISRGSASGTVQAWTVSNNSRTAATQTSINTGVTWTTQTYSLDNHLHQWTGTEYLNYFSQANNGSTTIYSSNTSELIDIAGSNPSPPVITSPLETVQNTTFLNITWTLAQPTVPGAKIQNYTLHLHNPDLSFNRTIAITGNSTTSYYWNVYAQNLSLGSYLVEIHANDSLGGTAADEERFNLTRNAIYNLTFRSALNNLVLGNGTAQLLNLNTSQTETFNVLNGLLNVNVVKGYSYNLTPDLTGYSITNSNITTDATNNSKLLNITLYTNNSVYIFAYDETTGVLITQNLTIVITGLAEVTRYTVNGTHYEDNLADGEYTIKLSGANYSLTQYAITVSSRSTQTLNAFLSANSQTVTFTILDADSAAIIPDATFTQSRLINGTWTVIQSKTSDITGRVQVNYLPSVNYQFIASKTGYNTNLFYLNPVIFSTYNVRLERTTALTPANTPDYQGLSVSFTPTTFYNNQSNTFYWVISSPSGSLTAYQLNLSYPGGNSTDNGVNAYGESFTRTFNITGANTSSQVILTYCYDTSTSPLKCFTYKYGIIGSFGNESFLGANQNQATRYGFGALDGVLIATVVTLVISGLAFSIGGILAGLPIALLLLGMFYYTGFISLWGILPSMLIGLFIIFGRTEGG